MSLEGQQAEQQAIQENRAADRVAHDAFAVHFHLKIGDLSGSDGIGVVRSAGRTRPRTVMVCFSEFTAISLVPSTTRCRSAVTSTTRAEMVVVRVMLRGSVPVPANS